MNNVSVGTVLLTSTRWCSSHFFFHLCFAEKDFLYFSNQAADSWVRNTETFPELHFRKWLFMLVTLLIIVWSFDSCIITWRFPLSEQTKFVFSVTNIQFTVKQVPMFMCVWVCVVFLLRVAHTLLSVIISGLLIQAVKSCIKNKKNNTMYLGYVKMTDIICAIKDKLQSLDVVNLRQPVKL